AGIRKGGRPVADDAVPIPEGAAGGDLVLLLVVGVGVLVERHFHAYPRELVDHELGGELLAGVLRRVVEFELERVVVVEAGGGKERRRFFRVVFGGRRVLAGVRGLRVEEERREAGRERVSMAVALDAPEGGRVLIPV